jgi:hypothetical protein
MDWGKKFFMLEYEILRSENYMPTLMQRAKSLSDAGRTEAEIAVELGLSEKWVSMLMNADSFALVKGVGDEEEGSGRDGGHPGGIEGAKGSEG